MPPLHPEAKLSLLLGSGHREQSRASSFIWVSSCPWCGTDLQSSKSVSHRSKPACKPLVCVPSPQQGSSHSPWLSPEVAGAGILAGTRSAQPGVTALGLCWRLTWTGFIPKEGFHKHFSPSYPKLVPASNIFNLTKYSIRFYSPKKSFLLSQLSSDCY